MRRCRQFHRGCALAFPPRALPLAFVAKAHADGLRGEERLRPSLQGPGDDGVLRQPAEALPSFEFQRVSSKRPWNLGPDVGTNVCAYIASLGSLALIRSLRSLASLPHACHARSHRFALLHSLRSPHPTHGVGRFASPRSPHSLASLRPAHCDRDRNVFCPKANNELFLVCFECCDKINALETDKSMYFHVRYSQDHARA